tara:strand:- start:3995 stop:4765 length:771 start_codon:yes stop_codon:yes gene_type:complete
MLKKRLIGVITVLDNWAVQSKGYKDYLPLGKPSVLAKNLDNWGADEIFIQIIDRTKNNLGPDFNLIKSLAELSLSTPLTYAGGISSINDAINVIKNGCERISIDSLIHNDPSEVEKIASILGSQALIASIPVSINQNNIFWYDYKKNLYKERFEELEKITSQKLVSEILLIDKDREGFRNSFQEEIINLFPIKDFPLIIFGGITEREQIKNFFNYEFINSVAIGNSLNYKEHMIQNHKKALNNEKTRTAFYKNDIF